MNISKPVSDNGSLSPPSRRSGTPPGYRNIRVLVPSDLHWRLASYASQSQLTMPAFVLATLQRATPLGVSTDPSISTPGRSPSVSGQIPARATPRPQVEPSPASACQALQDPVRTSGTGTVQVAASNRSDPLPADPDASITQPFALDSMPSIEAPRA